MSKQSIWEAEAILKDFVLCTGKCTKKECEEAELCSDKCANKERIFIAALWIKRHFLQVQKFVMLWEGMSARECSYISMFPAIFPRK